MPARTKTDRKPGPSPPRKPRPEDTEVPPGQHPVRQTKDPRQPPREEEAAIERPHPGRHHPARDGL
jgi:hypothetical protein